MRIVVLQVTDTGRYGDTRLNSTDKVKELCECITASMKANEGLGYHAFLFVLTYPFRLTEEEKSASLQSSGSLAERTLFPNMAFS